MTQAGLHQVRRRRRLPHPGPRWARRAGGEAQGRGLRRPRSCTPRRTPTCCCSPTWARVYRLRGHEIPMKERTAKGTAIVNLLNLQPDETIQAIVTTTDFPDDKFLVFATANGPGEEDGVHRVRQVAPGGLDRHQPARRRRARAGGRDRAATTTLIMVTRNGACASASPRPTCATMGRDAAGVRGIKLRADDKVVSSTWCATTPTSSSSPTPASASAPRLERFNRQGRGGQGVRAIKLTAARGPRGRGLHGAPRRRDPARRRAAASPIRTPVREISVAGPRRHGRAGDEPRRGPLGRRGHPRRRTRCPARPAAGSSARRLRSRSIVSTLWAPGMATRPSTTKVGTPVKPASRAASSSARTSAAKAGPSSRARTSSASRPISTPSSTRVSGSEMRRPSLKYTAKSRSVAASPRPRASASLARRWASKELASWTRSRWSRGPPPGRSRSSGR